MKDYYVGTATHASKNSIIFWVRVKGGWVQRVGLKDWWNYMHVEPYRFIWIPAKAFGSDRLFGMWVKARV